MTAWVVGLALPLMFAPTAPATDGEPSGFLESGYELVPPPQGPGVDSATVVGLAFTLDEDELDRADDPPPGGGNPCPDEQQPTNSVAFRIWVWRDRSAGGRHGHLRGRLDWLSVLPPFDENAAWKVTRFHVNARASATVGGKVHARSKTIARSFAPPVWGYVSNQSTRDFDEEIEQLLPPGSQIEITINFPGGAAEALHVNQKRSISYAWCRNVDGRWVWEKRLPWRWSFAV